MRNAMASGIAISPPITVRMIETSIALIAETAILVATADPPKMMTAARAAVKTAQFIYLGSLSLILSHSAAHFNKQISIHELIRGCLVLAIKKVLVTWPQAVDFVPALRAAFVLHACGIPGQ